MEQKLTIKNYTVRAMIFAVATMGVFLLNSVINSQQADAATITVSGPCSLDDAVASMNAAADEGGCVSTGDYGTDDKISLGAGTFPYANEETITVPLVVEGVGMGQTIIDAGGNNSGLIFENTTPTEDYEYVTVQDLTIKNAGGGANRYSLRSVRFMATVKRVEITSDSTDNNVAYALDIATGNYASQINDNIVESVYIHDMQVGAGAIRVYDDSSEQASHAIVRNSTVSNVHLTNSGIAVTVGAYNDGSMYASSVTNNTFQDITFDGGGVYVAAIAESAEEGNNSYVNLYLQNNTFRATKNNTGAGVAFVGVVAVNAVGGEFTTASASVVLAGNLFVTVPGTGACAVSTFGTGEYDVAEISSYGSNMSNDNSCEEYLTHYEDHNNIASLADFMGALKFNGGSTPTIGLMPGSPAIDAAEPTQLGTEWIEFDQRGVSRPQGEADDIGAFEFSAADIPAVDPEEEGQPDGGTENVPGTPTANASLASTGNSIHGYLLIAVALVATGTTLFARHRFRSVV
jgi:hypothetical protein